MKIQLKIEQFLNKKRFPQSSSPQQTLDKYFARLCKVCVDENLKYFKSGYIRINRKTYRAIEHLRRALGFNTYSKVIQWLIEVYENYKVEAIALRCAAEEVLTDEQLAEFEAKVEKYIDQLTNDFDDP